MSEHECRTCGERAEYEQDGLWHCLTHAVQETGHRYAAADGRAEQLADCASLYAIARKDFHASKIRLAQSVRDAVAAGMSEVEAARVAGVTRPTVRKWLGKDGAK